VQEETVGNWRGELGNWAKDRKLLVQNKKTLKIVGRISSIFH